MCKVFNANLRIYLFICEQICLDLVLKLRGFISTGALGIIPLLKLWPILFFFKRLHFGSIIKVRPRISGLTCVIHMNVLIFRDYYAMRKKRMKVEKE